MSQALWRSIRSYRMQTWRVHRAEWPAVSVARIEGDTYYGDLLTILFFPATTALVDDQGATLNLIDELSPGHPELGYYVRIAALAHELVWYLDILRNERPDLAFTPGAPENSRLSTRWTRSAWGHLE